MRDTHDGSLMDQMIALEFFESRAGTDPDRSERPR
jgi:hypothetical protein